MQIFLILLCFTLTHISHTADDAMPNLDKIMTSINSKSELLTTRLESNDFVFASKDIDDLNTLIQEMNTAKSHMTPLLQPTEYEAVKHEFEKQPTTALGLLTSLSLLPNSLALAKAYTDQTTLEHTELTDAKIQMSKLEEMLTPWNTLVVMGTLTNPEDPELLDLYKQFKNVQVFSSFLKSLTVYKETA